MAIINDALGQLELAPVSQPELVSRGRHVVYRVGVVDAGGRESDVAVRLADPRRPEWSVRDEQRIAHAWSSLGAKIVRPLSPDPVRTRSGRIVGVWEWVQDTGQPISAREWGEMLRVLHDTGENINAEVHDPLWVVRGKRSAMELAASDPDHPMSRHPGLFERFWREMDTAEREVEQLFRDAQDFTCIHGDYTPGNLVHEGRRGYLTHDLEGAGWGPRAADFAVMDVGVAHYGWDPRYRVEMRRGYGASRAPREDAVRAFGRIRELSSIGFAMLFANVGPEFARELEKRLPVLEDPRAQTEPWCRVGGAIDTMRAGQRVVLGRTTGRTNEGSRSLGSLVRGLDSLN